MDPHSDSGLHKVDLREIEPPKAVKRKVRFGQWVSYVWHAVTHLGHQGFSISEPKTDLYVLACRCGKIFASTPGYKDSSAWDHARRLVLYNPEK